MNTSDTRTTEERVKRNQQIVEAYMRLGDKRAVAREFGVDEGTVRRVLKRAKVTNLTGTIHGTRVEKRPLPAEGRVKRYVVTSAQNNTKVHDRAWEALTALAKHYRAEILVGTFSYDQNLFRAMSVKRGKEKPAEWTVWFDERVKPYVERGDQRIQLAPGLVWCGEMNILPTMVNPLAGLETYSQRKSAIFPHAKMAMRSVPTMQGEGTKLNYTTGTITKRNYVQKRVGIIAEHHHVYGGLLVEVDADGHWWVRQLNFAQDGTLQDLDVVVRDGKVTQGNAVEAITWGDLHGTMVDPRVVENSLEMRDELRPRYQFIHDVLEGISINRHVEKNGATNDPHYVYYRWRRGLHRVDEEFRRTAELIKRYACKGSELIAPDANHDGWWLCSWLARFNYKVDPANAELFLDLQKWFYARLKEGKMARDVNVMEYAFKLFKLDGVRFLLPDESFKICGDKIECGMHGHLGPNGKRGRPIDLAKMGRKANIGHTHTAGIYDGLYVAGTSSKLRWSYNYGPSGWSHSHIVTYPNGKRAIVTMYAGKWKA